jgi:hypothetical protein
VRLSTLTTERAEDLVVHVLAREGRVSAALQAVDAATGGDWIPASAGPSGTVVLPGLPKDTEVARLVVFAPGRDDADLRVQLATPSSTITPAGHETLHVKNGMVAVSQMDEVTQGEPGSLVLTPTDAGKPVPVVAAVQIIRGKGADREMAFVSATGAVEEQATVSGNERKGGTLFLTAPGKAAKVRITSVAGGEPKETTVDVKAGTTLAVEPPEPSGKGAFAVTVTPVSGGPVHASRMLEKSEDGVDMFTVQPMPDDEATVTVPESDQNLNVIAPED